MSLCAEGEAENEAQSQCLLNFNIAAPCVPKPRDTSLRREERSRMMLRNSDNDGRGPKDKQNIEEVSLAMERQLKTRRVQLDFYGYLLLLLGLQAHLVVIN